MIRLGEDNATGPRSAEEIMGYEIKPCGESDAELIWEKSFEAVPTDGNACEERLVLKIADESDNIIGGCVLDIDTTKTAEFERLWVAEPYRRRGMGSALIIQAEQMAREKGCRTAVNTYNFDFQHARGLFEKQGYILSAVVKDWPKGHECYVLTKKLGFVEDGSSAPEGEQFTILPGTEEEGDLITAKLEESVRAFAPRSHGYIDIDKKLLDENGVTVGGCIAGVSGWDTLHIDAFRADEATGPYLLGEVEREAAAMGAYLACVSCAETQAQFFVKHGYSVGYCFEDEPKWYTLYKRLSSAEE